eukprot:4627243-Amphidinium_carterae.1
METQIRRTDSMDATLTDFKKRVQKSDFGLRLFNVTKDSLRTLIGEVQNTHAKPERSAVSERCEKRLSTDIWHAQEDSHHRSTIMEQTLQDGCYA